MARCLVYVTAKGLFKSDGGKPETRQGLFVTVSLQESVHQHGKYTAFDGSKRKSKSISLFAAAAWL